MIRLKAPDHYPIYKDLVFGKVRHGDNGKDPKSPVASNEDPILLKTDGFPTYHLANVVDDHMMEITYVIRGSVRPPAPPFVTCVLIIVLGMDVINSQASRSI